MKKCAWLVAGAAALLPSCTARMSTTCSLGDAPVVMVSYDSVTQRFALDEDQTVSEGEDADADASNPAGSGRKWLRGLEALAPPPPTNIMAPVTYRYKARRCPCSLSVVYCTLESGNYCGLDYSALQDNPQVSCYDAPSEQIVFVRNAWPVLVFWFCALAVFAVFSYVGRNARDFVLNYFFPSRNEEIINRILRREDLIHANIAGRNQPDNVPRVPLVLKTKTFKAHSGSSKEIAVAGVGDSAIKDNDESVASRDALSLSDNETNSEEGSTEPDLEHTGSDVILCQSTSPDLDIEEDDDDDNDSYDNVCTICYEPLVDGDRIGNLKCDHSFHATCLKEWIRRRNVCPLCQQPEIASPTRSAGADSAPSTPAQSPVRAQNSPSMRFSVWLSASRVNYFSRNDTNGSVPSSPATSRSTVTTPRAGSRPLRDPRSAPPSPASPPSMYARRSSGSSFRPSNILVPTQETGGNSLSTAPTIVVPTISRSFWRSPPSDPHSSESHSLDSDSVDDIQFGEG